jgi:hypothetical protein
LKNVNLTNVRSATSKRLIAGVAAAATLLAACALVPLAQAGEGASKPTITRLPDRPTVTVVVLPVGTEPSDLADAGLSPGALSPGLSTVPPDQTFLDITQGNRVHEALYDGDLPQLTPTATQVAGWGKVLERADSAPAEIVPGLLATTIKQAGLAAAAEHDLLSAALIAADRAGHIDRNKRIARVVPGMVVTSGEVADLPALISVLEGDDLLIAIESPPAPRRSQLAIGIAGDGFDGNLTSDTTRVNGFVLTTDIGPTILDRLGVDIPDQMSGEVIRSEGEVDAAAIEDRIDRMRVVSPRRDRVIGKSLLLWSLIAALVCAFSRGRLARPALMLLGLSAICLPVLLLFTAALEPTSTAERQIVTVGAPLLAGLIFAVFRGWTRLAVACGVFVSAYAVDVLLGSPLTVRSLLGPNPGLGVRFYGIGNELESALAVAIPVGVGAALQAVASRRGEPVERRTAIAAFAGSAVVLGGLFAAGRFGADVGAAIVIPAGAATAILALPGALRRRRLVLAVLAAPVVGVVLLATIDLLFGGDSHLSRSVLDAGGAGDIADVAERRLRLSARSFGQATQLSLFRIAVAGAIAGVVWHRRILGWLADVPFARAGYIGATLSVPLGVVANDSGATFLTIGVLGVMACVAFAWGARNAEKPGSKQP